jgi:hypothetical protein
MTAGPNKTGPGRGGGGAGGGAGRGGRGCEHNRQAMYSSGANVVWSHVPHSPPSIFKKLVICSKFFFFFFKG